MGKQNIEEVPVLILVGGLGTRLRPFTETVPKPMIDINGKPFLEYKINQIKKFGIKKIILCVGYLGDIVEAYFGNGEKFGVEIFYSYEKELLGTAGAIKNAENLIKSDSVIVMNGDTYTNVDLSKLFFNHLENNSPVTIVVTDATNPREQELVELENQVITSLYKRNTLEHQNHLNLTRNPLINAGIYVLEKEILNSIPPGIKVSLEQEIFPKFINNMNGFSYSGYIKDLATIQFCREFEKDLLEGKI
jgi:NDP-sugar pyrophosphorylase family protein